jgi:hypothetical protein
MPTQARISPSAMSEIEAAFKVYCSAVESSDLTFSSQSTYVDRAYNFLRRLKYDFDPGSRLAPYSPVKRKKDLLAS